MTQIPVSRTNPVAMPEPQGVARRGIRADVASVVVLLAAVVIIGATASWHGEFWYSDAPRHALNGVFVADLLKELPSPAHARQWAIDYYLQYPALTILFYPPLFPAAEAAVVLAIGPSNAAPILTELAFYAALALGTYALARRWLAPALACAAALLLCSFPEVALWGRQVMTDVPALAFLVWSAYCLERALDERGQRFLYAAAALLVLAAYTKLTAIFVVPVYVFVLLWRRGGAALRDRHVWLVCVLAAIAMIPLALLTLKFGQANVQSVVGLSNETVARNSLRGWIFYLLRLPHQVGWVPLGLAAGYALLLPLRRSTALPRPAIAFLLAWFAVNYVFFSAIDLKTDRLTLVLLVPVSIFAVAFLRDRLPGPRLAAAAGLALAGGSLAWTLVYAPVPRVAGYAEAAQWITAHTPPGRVLFSGSRDGSFIFNLRLLDRERRYTVVRSDKLLLNVAVSRSFGVSEKDVSPDQLAAMFHDYALSYVVAERDFWTDLGTMRELQTLLDSNRFEEVDRIAIAANVPHADKELRIYRWLGPTAAEPKPLQMDLLMINRTIEQAPSR